MRIQIFILGLKGLNVPPTTQSATQITHDLLYGGSQYNQQRNSRSNLKVIHGCKSYQGQTFSLPRVVATFLLFGPTLIGFYGLNLPEVERLLVPSVPVKLSQMHLLKSDTSFNWTCIITPYQQFIPTKKTKMLNMNVILEKNTLTLCNVYKK